MNGATKGHVKIKLPSYAAQSNAVSKVDAHISKLNNAGMLCKHL